MGHGRDVLDEAVCALVRKRAKPLTILLNSDLTISFAEREALVYLADLLDAPDQNLGRLPLPLETCIRRVVQAWDAGEPAEHVINPLPKVVLRVTRLTGGTGSCIAVFLERPTAREDLAAAVSRFALTRRETEVLSQILGGASAGDIAVALNISERTVSDYFKILARKTQAKNRADMVAKVLGWSGIPERDAHKRLRAQA